MTKRRWLPLALSLGTSADDPAKVSYVQFTEKDMDADPPYVMVRVWPYSPRREARPIQC